MLSNDANRFKKITSSQGFLRSFYSKLKNACSDEGAVGRVFITGVTSISLDSVTSGFNVTSNYTSDPAFASLFGFTEFELRRLIPELVDLEKVGMTLDAVVERMRVWYNGYRFSADSEETVFNSSMCLYYLDFLRRLGREPTQLLDPAVTGDLEKILGILRLGSLTDVKEIVNDAIAGKPLPFSDQPELLNLQKNGRFSRNGLLTALVYLGYLTYAAGSRAELVVPNRAMRQQFFDVYFQYLRGVDDWSASVRTSFSAALQALEAGDPKPLAESVAQRLAQCCGRQKGLFLRESDYLTALLMVTSYAPDVETIAELEVRNGVSGVADVLLKSRTGGNSYLFELKYLPKSRGTLVAVQRELKKAKEQADQYMESKNIACLQNLQRVAVVYVGTELKAIDVRRSC